MCAARAARQIYIHLLCCVYAVIAATSVAAFQIRVLRLCVMYPDKCISHLGIKSITINPGFVAIWEEEKRRGRHIRLGPHAYHNAILVWHRSANVSVLEFVAFSCSACAMVFFLAHT